MDARRATTENRLGSLVLSIGLGAGSRVLMLRDRVLKVTRGLRRHETAQEYFFQSGTRRLSCAYVPGAARGPSVLLCHGIGETIEHWSAVQALLADHGVGSLVFNYSGYGRSSGRVRAEHCDEDFIAAYGELRRRVGGEVPVFVLGFSMGSGIAAKGTSTLQPAAAGLFLCEGFDSFRNAARAVGVPRWLTLAIPDIWTTAETVAQVRLPVWVVHSDCDQLFPMTMAEHVSQACGAIGELVRVQGFSHNELYLIAAKTYWEPILERMHARRAESATPGHQGRPWAGG